MIIACFVRCDASRLERTAFIFTTSPGLSGWWIGERRHRLNKIMYTFNYIMLTLKNAYIITNYPFVRCPHGAAYPSIYICSTDSRARWRRRGRSSNLVFEQYLHIVRFIL